MFTGIIQRVGTVVRVAPTPCRSNGSTPAHRLEIELGPLADGLQLGASVAVNGVCLTLALLRGRSGGFDVVPETWSRTTLSELQPGDEAHLECSLRVGDPLDGHFVQGHVDGTGRIDRIDRGQGEWKLWLRTERALLPFIVPKGSIALDGTSLTVVDVADDRFSVVLVPTTLQRTTFRNRRLESRVNIETDILARLVVSRLTGAAPPSGSAAEATGLSWDKLRAGGYVT